MGDSEVEVEALAVAAGEEDVASEVDEGVAEDSRTMVLRQKL